MDTPEIRYARAKDGTRISYTFRRGTGTPLLWVSWTGGAHSRVEAANWAREHGVE